MDAFRRALAIVRNHSTVAEGMAALLSRQRLAYPDEDWESIAALDLAADAGAMFAWLSRLLTDEPPADHVSGSWFGLFDPIVRGRATRGFYLSGSARFDVTATEPDWPCWTDYWPEGRYVRSKVLEPFHRAYECARSADREVADELDYTCCLSYAGLWVREAMTRVDRRLFLGRRAYRGISFGFDSGDLITLGVLHQDGLELALPS